MKITHFNNSFLEILIRNFKIVCDPWFYPANHGGWQATPSLSKHVYKHALSTADIIYISHLHSDHLDERLLHEFRNNIHAEFLVPAYKNRHLAKRIKNILPHNVCHELEPLKSFEPITSVELYIYPQMSSSQTINPAEDKTFSYDLDSSLLTIDRISGSTFFNQVDNPLSVDDFRNLKIFLRDLSVKRLDCLCMAVGAASQYPQCFLDQDLVSAKEKVLKRFLADFSSKLSIINPKVFFPAGGDYSIGLPYCHLEKYMAVPSFNVLDCTVKSASSALALDLRGGKSLDLQSLEVTSNHEFNANIINESNNDHRKFVDLCINKETLMTEEQFSCYSLAELFVKAKNNYFSRFLSIADLQNSMIFPDFAFILYENSPVTVEILDSIIHISAQSNPTDRFELEFAGDLANEACQRISIEYHMTSLDFRKLLCRIFNWNQYTAGSNCLLRRAPDVHIPWHEMSLNFLVV